MKKNKVLLLFPRMGFSALKPQSPLSLLALAPYLEDAGFDPVIIDTRVPGDHLQRIASLLPETLFVGITSMTGLQIQYALELADLVRAEAPEVPIVWGGVHATILPEQTMADPRVDIVAIGEGEAVIVELARCLAADGDLNAVKGIYFNDADRIIFTGKRPFLDLKEMKTASWHLVDMSQYGVVAVQTGRGCPYGCRFCYNHLFNFRRWRPKDIDLVIEELQLLYEKYGVERVQFVDDNFFSNVKRVKEICRRIIDAGIKIKWNTTCRADILARHFDEEMAMLLKKAGNEILFVGSESGSNRILKDIINKRINVDDITGMAKNTRKLKVQVHTSFMIGLPSETDEERKQTFSLMDTIRRIDPDIVITALCIYTPYPGSPLYNDIVELGFQEPANLSQWAELNFFSCGLPWIDGREQVILENLAFISRFVFWNTEIKERYLKFYHYPFYLLLRLDALLRWKLRWFSSAPEWTVFRRFVRQLEG